MWCFPKGLWRLTNLTKLSLDNNQLTSMPKELGQLKNICAEADVLGISSYASTAPRAVQIINFLKKLNKPLIWGVHSDTLGLAG